MDNSKQFSSPGFRAALIGIFVALLGFLIAQYAPGDIWDGKPFSSPRNMRGATYAFFGGIGGVLIGLVAFRKREPE